MDPVSSCLNACENNSDIDVLKNKLLIYYDNDSLDMLLIHPFDYSLDNAPPTAFHEY